MSYVSPGLSAYVRDFSAGFLDTPEVDTLPPGATPDAKNALFSKIGEGRVTVKKRGGARLLNPTVIASGKGIDGLAEYRRSGSSPLLLAVCNGTVYQFDNVDTFNAVTGGSGFTAGTAARFAYQKNQIVVMDGTAMKRIDSTVNAFAVGFAAPTAAPALATAAGPGVTGTYEGFAVWYDSVTDHESSPSAVSTAVVFANQTRSWTKPAGAPPANVTHWRVYVRRTDTNEANYYRAGSFTIGSGTGTETTSDAARTNLGPAPNANDPPPGNFSMMVMFRGYAVGVLATDTTLYFSKLGDFESWNPSDIFTLNFGRQELRSLKLFGEECVVQTPLMSFRLEGDRVPFKISTLHSGFGNVSHDAAVEVGAWLYAWDELKGPYRVDRSFQQWEPLADNRVRTLIDTVNRAQLAKIRCLHDPKRHLVLWAFPVGTSARLRTVAVYDYSVDRWCPPMTGLEYASFANFTTAVGAAGVYIGDLWGRVYELFAQTDEGVPSGTTSAPITGATSSTVTAASATFYTSGNGLAGMSVAVRSPAGVWQWRRIQSNTSTVITLDTTNDNPWTTTPATDGTWTVYVGGIEWYWTTPYLDGGRPDRVKRGTYFAVEGRTTALTYVIEVYARFNNDAVVTTKANYPVSSAQGAVWGEAIWGTSMWGGTTRQPKKQRLNRTFLNAQFRMQNFYPGQSVEVLGYVLEADVLPRRRALGVA